MAASAHFSRFHLSRLLREHLGFPLRDFLAALRVERGIEALVAGHDVIRSQVEAGHESASSFSRSFARHTGMAPSRYRDQLRFLAAYLIRHMDSTDPLVAVHRNFPEVSHPQQVQLRISVDGAQAGSALFVALNSSLILQGAPNLGVALLGTRGYTVSEIPDGTYYAMVVEVPRSAGMRAYFQMDRNRRQLRREPITFPLSEPTEIVLTLRDLVPTDPPITPNLPKLFFEGALSSVTVEASNSGQESVGGRS
ncbi:Helix-turn-helix domain-containing protein [Tessaracoccus flavus]|nr:Helix-turn-helix domain-containing protein [Tessaracoccus flavus]